VSREAILSAENSEKPLGGWGSQHFPDLDGGEGLLPLLKKPNPTLDLQPFSLAPNDKSWVCP